jgi:hypothetical protein
LKEAEIPFELVRNEDSLSELKDAVIVVGEGVSFRDYRGLFGVLTLAAARGVPVICLAPSEGEITIDGGEGRDMMNSMRFRKKDIITELDKKLDTRGWPPDGKMFASAVQLRGERGPVVGEVSDNINGWPWIEIGFGENRRRLVLCGFEIIGKWEAGPTPRFLFAEMLEYVDKGATKQRREGGER